jgi:hypothetical protein
MELISCSNCNQCNHKGKPSVTRLSAYCDNHRIDNKIIRTGFFKSFTERIFTILHPDNKSEIKKGGFRISWYDRRI